MGGKGGCLHQPRRFGRHIADGWCNECMKR
nr:MAG TPA: Neuropeptide FF [Caudoviricetes sp.]